MLNLKQFLIAIAVSASLVIAGGYSSSAIAGYSFVHSNVQKNKDGSTTIHTIIENDETGAQGVHWLHITAINFVLLLFIMWLFSVFKPRETELPSIHFERSDTSDIATAQWSGTGITGIIVVGLVVFLYFYLHWF